MDDAANLREERVLLEPVERLRDGQQVGRPGGRCRFGGATPVFDARGGDGVGALAVARFDADDVFEVRGEGDRRLPVARADVDRQVARPRLAREPGIELGRIDGAKARVIRRLGREQILECHGYCSFDPRNWVDALATRLVAGNVQRSRRKLRGRIATLGEVGDAEKTGPAVTDTASPPRNFTLTVEERLRAYARTARLHSPAPAHRGPRGAADPEAAGAAPARRGGDIRGLRCGARAAERSHREAQPLLPDRGATSRSTSGPAASLDRGVPWRPLPAVTAADLLARADRSIPASARFRSG